MCGPRTKKMPTPVLDPQKIVWTNTAEKVSKSCQKKDLHTKKARVKRWWNCHLFYYFERSQHFSTHSTIKHLSWDEVSKTCLNICDLKQPKKCKLKSITIDVSISNPIVILRPVFKDRCQFHQHFMSSLWAHRSQKCKKTLLGSVDMKAGHKHVGKIDPFLNTVGLVLCGL